jgi:cobalt-zinc-cadmium efflux system protein
LGDVLADAREALHHDFDIDHATLQVEPVGAGGRCTPAGW